MRPASAPNTTWQALLVALMTAAFAATPAGCASSSDEAVCPEPSSELFEQRVLPLLADDQPSSCNQCHLSGIDLALVVRDTPCQSMACLVQQELVDLEHPERSAILDWIRRAEPDSELITADVIELEYQAFLEWIELESSCRSCAGTPCPERATDAPFCEPVRTPDQATEISARAGDCSDRTLEQLFLETLYASRGRCYPCHFDGNDSVKEAPKFISQSGTCEAASLATMRNIIGAGYVDVDNPAQSLILLKPLAEAYGGVAHGGHDKFGIEDDPAYENFLAWLTHYAECQKPGEPAQ